MELLPQCFPAVNEEIRCMFPGKSLFGCHGVQLDERRLQLENWTRDMILGPNERLAAAFPGWCTDDENQKLSHLRICGPCCPSSV